MHILLLEPFYTGSHQLWAEGLQKHSTHRIDLISLPGRHWKWRMHGAAITFARQLSELSYIPDLILATDMMDLAAFRGLLPSRFRAVPLALYFHENQLSYPWSPSDPDPSLGRDRHYAFINYTSALAADQVFFSSAYQQRGFLDAIPEFLNAFPDHRELSGIERIERNSKVLHLGLELESIPHSTNWDSDQKKHTLLWNHRWEYDKNPDLFFNTLFQLSDEGIDFQLIVTGEHYKQSPAVFREAGQRLKKHIIHWGYCEDREDYYRLLRQATILPVTNYQDFFGISIMEAIWCGAEALLPNRLAYPELFGSIAEFYNSEQEFEFLLKTKLTRPVTSELPKHREQLKVFDWQSIIKDYDRAFQQCL